MVGPDRAAMERAAVLAPRPDAGFPNADRALAYLRGVLDGVASAEHADEAVAVIRSELGFLRAESARARSAADSLADTVYRQHAIACSALEALHAGNAAAAVAALRGAP